MTASATPPKPADHTYNGLFFVYDRTGKEALLSKAVLRMRGQEKELPQISQITVAGVPTLKVERKTGTTYWVEHGKYAASATERSVLEDILGRLEGKARREQLARTIGGLQGSTTATRRRRGRIFRRNPEPKRTRSRHAPPVSSSLRFSTL